MQDAMCQHTQLMFCECEATARLASQYGQLCKVIAFESKRNTEMQKHLGLGPDVAGQQYQGQSEECVCHWKESNEIAAACLSVMKQAEVLSGAVQSSEPLPATTST